MWWRATHQISCLYQTSTRWRAKDEVKAYITDQRGERLRHWVEVRQSGIVKKNFRKADDWPPPWQPQLLPLRSCLDVVFDLVSTCWGSLDLQSKLTVRVSSIFDRFRTDDPWLVNLSLVRISFEEFVLERLIFYLTPAPLRSLGTLLGHGFLNLWTDQQVTSFIPAPKISDPVVRSLMTCL